LDGRAGKKRLNGQKRYGRGIERGEGWKLKC
jgi:hypothetical protein